MDHFMGQHHDKLQMHWSKLLDSKFAQTMNPGIVKHWFDLVKKHVTNMNILLHNIYRMDKCGFPPSDQDQQHIIGCCGNQVQHKQGGENVTALAIICDDGTVLEPTIIFKGMNL